METLLNDSGLATTRYAIQRLATSVGIFTREPGPDAIVVRVAPCPD